MNRFRYVLFLVLPLGSSVSWADDEPPSFARDVRPILSDKCYRCHGPDEQAREADLRFDLRDDALHVLSPDEPAESELLARVTNTDPDLRMPPRASKLTLSNDEIDTLRRWIESGSPYERHWSFSALAAPDPPRVEDSAWPRNAIDLFVLARLERAGLQPAPVASRQRLIRRLSFDLTGVPPTLEEIDRFVSDTSADAYERLVERMLEKEQFGERLASDWLDVARYSDTYGYQVDRERYVWPWRDWVIDAFNRNMPYDEFVVQQLSGDLLAGATESQILATTFNRLHSQKVEGGSVPEEFRVEYVADRVHTLATAFMGLTMECARCHDHKYDPITQQEYYQLFAFFNNIDEAGLYSYFTSSIPTPTLLLADDKTRASMQAVDRQIEQAEAHLRQCATEQNALFERWLANRPGQPTIPGEIQHLDFEGEVPGPNQSVEGPRGKAAQLTGDDGIGLKVGNFSRNDPFTVALWLNTPEQKERAVVFHRSRAWTDAASRGYELLIHDGRLRASLIHFWPGNSISVETRQLVATKSWVHVAITYDGSSRARGLRIFVDGLPADVDVVRDNLYKNITGGGGDNITIGERFRDRGFSRGQVDEFRVYERELTPIEIAQLRDEASLQELLAKPAAELTSLQRDELLGYYLATASSEYEARLSRLREIRRERSKAVDGISEIMVMREMPTRRESFLLKRGAYDAPGDAVSPDTPAWLLPFPEGQPRNRLGLARWLTDPRHPLTARVAINRFWQQCFGQGLVRTPEDFGSQGEPPTHPQLMDWLARDFIDSGWSVKRLLKTIVMSATYRQDSVATPEKVRRDPDNRLLARAPRFRLSAEMIRDNALAASGLLVSRIGGPPARPYEVAVSFKPLKQDSGDGLYRRSLYTFWKRTAPAPVMMALDASKRDVCVVKRERTSSPLQAFVLLNDPQFVEASRVLAQRLLREHDHPVECVRHAFRLLTSRPATQVEERVLLDLWESQQAHFEQFPEKAATYLKNGEAPVDDQIPSHELAAASAVISTLMNYDECVMRR